MGIIKWIRFHQRIVPHVKVQGLFVTLLILLFSKTGVFARTAERAGRYLRKYPKLFRATESLRGRELLESARCGV